MSGLMEKVWVGALAGIALLLLVLVMVDLGVISLDGEAETAESPRTTTTPQNVPPAAQLVEPGIHQLVSAQDLSGVQSGLAGISLEELNMVRDGMTPIMLAASAGDPEIVSLLLEYGADPNIRGWAQRTALQYAAEKNRFDAAKILLAAGADINGVDETNLSPLVMTIDRGYDEFAYWLIEQGADLEIQHVNGYTALINAAGNGDMQMVKTLISRGANVNHPLPDGRTAADLAQQLQHFEVAVYLKALESD